MSGFAIVKFSDGYTGIVAGSWPDDKGQCYWPHDGDSAKVTQLVIKGAAPDLSCGEMFDGIVLARFSK